MEEGSIAVLVDAKEEYTKQLISVLKPCIYQGVKSIYLDAKDICNQDNTPEKVLMVFQDLLSRIPKWSQDIITKEFERIVSVSKCDYIEDLLKVIYVSHIKVLTIVHSAQKNKKLSIKVPNGGHFVHLCYIECAREFWKDPYLFSENANKYELQKNMRDSESMISECIAETIRRQLPVRHILKEFLNEPDEEIEEADDDVREPANKKYMKKLESVVKKELKTTGKSSAIGEIDIDLIRKVIREELNTRPQTDIIKKELVETVVEKIVEQATEVGTETNEKTIIEDIKENKEVKEVKEVNEESQIQNILPNTNILSLASASTSASESASTSSIDNQENIKNGNTKNTENEKAKEKTNENDNVNTSIIELESSNMSANNLESLLDELPIRTPSENTNIGSAPADDEIVLESTDNNQVDKEKEKEKDKDKEKEKEKHNDNIKLQINDVDEINLNLDEFDNEDIIFGESELEEIDIKSKATNETKNKNRESKESNETKKDNTKYIFFKE